jgi:hypothetical protein
MNALANSQLEELDKFVANVHGERQNAAGTSARAALNVLLLNDMRRVLCLDRVQDQRLRALDG